MRLKSGFCLFATLVLISMCVFGQEGPGKRFGNAEVISLVKAGLDDSVVVAKIKQAPDVDFKLEADDLVALKNAGASRDVISAMLARVTPAVDNKPQPGPAAAFGVNKTGTVVLVTRDGRQEISPSMGEFSNAGFYFVQFVFLNYPGLVAKIRTDDRRPGLLIKSDFDPREHYYIVKLDPDKKINSRSLKIKGKVRAFSSSAGIRPDEDWMLGYTSKEDERGVWRMTPNADLAPGEYGIFDGMRLFGFGVGHS